MITDDSAAEQAAVKQAFSGLVDGEQEVDHLLCVVHSERTLRRNLSGPRYKQSLSHMLKALKYRKTEPGCEDSVQQALNSLPPGDSKKENYLVREWWQTRKAWANFARSHSTLLLQVRSTNAVESFHSALKHAGKSELQRFSLKGLVMHVLTTDKEYKLRANKASIEFRTKIHPKQLEYPYLQHFPFPVQNMIVEELRLAEAIVEDGEDELDRLEDNLNCTCIFWRKWQVPCRHILANDKLTGCLISDNWLRWSHMWKESGYEIYERMTTVYYEQEVDDDIGAPMRKRLEMREALEEIRGKYFDMEEEAAKMDTSEASNKLIDGWLAKLHKITSEIRSLAVTQLLKELDLEDRAKKCQQEAELEKRRHLLVTLPEGVPISSACR